VVDLCDAILEEPASRQHRFDWLVGDPGADGVGASALAESALDVMVGELPNDETVKLWTLHDDADDVRGQSSRLNDGGVPQRTSRSGAVHAVPLGAARVLMWMATLRMARTESPIDARNAAL
jgi:hypothetical protein